MFEYLRDHSVKNIMCHPEQDHQQKFRLHKITGLLSPRNYVYINGRKVVYPAKNKRFHIYRIGNIDPSVLKLLEEYPLWRVDQWIKIDELMNATTHMAFVYTQPGIVIPPHLCQYQFTNNRDLLVAIEDDYTLGTVKLNEETIFLKTYKNAYYARNSLEGKTSPASKSTYCYSVKVTDTTSRFDAQVAYLQYKNKPGAVMAFVNGLMVDVIAADVLKAGDFVYFYYDASVDRVVDLELNQLDTFISEMDAMYKYILHYEGGGERIDFKDDLELFVIKPYTGPMAVYQNRGIYYHTNSHNAIRNLTHKDYSVPVEYVEYSANHLKNFLNDDSLAIQNFKVRLYIRKSGYDRRNVFESSRLHELYRLPDTYVKRALSGLDANVPFWHANQLEQSAYMRVVSSRYDQLTKEQIEEALGYNAITKLLGDTMQTTYTKSTRPYVRLQPQHYRNSTIYEYSAEGVLLDILEHLEGSDYYAKSNGAAYIEAITGLSGINTGTEISNVKVKLPPREDNYRIYKGDLINNRVNNWRDITDTLEWRIVGEYAELSDPDPSLVIMIVSDTRFYRYEANLTQQAGNFYIRLIEEVLFNGQKVTMEMPIPRGELDVVLNGRSLIPGLDYSYQHPMLILNSKEYLNRSNDQYLEQSISVRFTGFCDAQLQMRDVDDIGYVIHGRLSRNRRYDVRDDRVLKIVVAGRCYPRSLLKFDEDHDAFPDTTHALNGTPYMVRDIVVPYKDYVRNRDTYQMRQDAVVKDNMIEDYLTVRFPHTPIEEPMAVLRRYRLYSPFLSELIYRLQTDLIDDEAVNVPLTSIVIENLVQSSLYLLPHEPCFDPRVDERFVIVEPHVFDHPVTLSIYKYRFLLRVVEIYLQGKVDLNTHVNYTL